MATSLDKLICSGKVHPSMTFNQRVWALVARIPEGQVTTYAALAHALGGRAYRAVGQARNPNPYAPQVPCHRVVGSTGRLTGFAQGLPAKERLLRAEGVVVANGRVISPRMWTPAVGKP
jgi:methylated-DNA-[protein]-cysteine S-methyltransferase